MPTGPDRSKSGITELLREPNSLSSSVFYVGFVRFFADFVPKRRPSIGAFLFLTCIQAQSLPKKMIAVSIIGGSWEPAIFGMTGLAYSDSLLHRTVLDGFYNFV